MGKTVHKRLTPHQKEFKRIRSKGRSNISWARKQGYILPEYFSLPNVPPSRITKEYLKNLELKTSRKYIISYSIGKKYKRVKNGKFFGGEVKYKPGQKIDTGIYKNKIRVHTPVPKELRYTPTNFYAVDYEATKHQSTSEDEAPFEDYILYQSFKSTLRDLNYTPFGNWLYNFIIGDVLNDVYKEALSKEQINSAIASLQAYGLILTKEMLYNAEETGTFARALINELPLSVAEKQGLFDYVDSFISANEIDIESANPRKTYQSTSYRTYERKRNK